MKFIFDKIEENTPNQYSIEDVTGDKTGNPLLTKLMKCYSRHYALTLTPDEILNNIACIYSKYVLHYAERFRSHFVSHVDKKELNILMGGEWIPETHPMILQGLIEKVREDSQNPAFDWFNVAFSTTKSSDVAVRYLAVLSSQKAYYKYSCTFCCGFPSVELLGTLEDWGFLYETIGEMPTLDDEFLLNWKNDLLKLVRSMVYGKEEFWQSGITRVPYGSGGQADYQGWILLLNPFNENMDILKTTIKETDFLNLELNIDVHINNNGDEFDVNIVGGPTKLIYDGTFKVENTFDYKRK